MAGNRIKRWKYQFCAKIATAPPKAQTIASCAAVLPDIQAASNPGFVANNTGPANINRVVAA